MTLCSQAKAISLLPLLVWFLGGCASTAPCTSCKDDSAIAPAAPDNAVQFRVQHRENTLHSCQAVTFQETVRSKTKAYSRSRPPLPPVQSARLKLLKGNGQAKQALIFIGGIHDTFRYFSSWAAPLTTTDNIIYGWEHDHRTMRMAESAKLLAQDLEALRSAGTGDITIVAHSIGGLVGKGAIDELARTGQAGRYARLDLHALGTPWGGFAVVKIALKVPGSIRMSKAIGYPMAPELKPGSPYLASLARAMPHNGRLYLYTGSADDVVQPARSSTRNQYALITKNAAMLTTIEGASHNDYNQALSLVDFIRKTSVQQCATADCLPAASEVRCRSYTAALGQNSSRQ